MSDGNVRQTFDALVDDLKNALQLMARWGSQGFECSPRSLAIINGWGEKHASYSEIETLEHIREVLGDCRRCRLAEKRTQLVFGEGNPSARLVFVGEGPGYDEDKSGRPFVGAAGKLLTKIIEAMGFTRDEVYICNIVKCRPPKNRNPEADEIAACAPFLEKQIRYIRPDYICALGAFAAQTLLKTNVPISGLRGRFHDYLGIKVLPTYHPAFLLRNPGKKRQTWEDVQKIMLELGLK